LIFRAESTARLVAIDDAVMEASRRAACATIPRSRVFEGVVSLDNNGGFASVRSAGNWRAEQ